ncbi:MAG: VWA domain-containing protein [Firmicutes bacterium]|nr:VWA domain-containing protein [Bacillota bacterium]
MTTVDLVNMVFTVTDRQGKFVTNLTKEDFQVFEEGQEQKIEFFSQETDLPLRIGLLLDTSNSIRNRLQFQQEAAIDFLHFVIRRRKDQAFLMTFDNEPAVVEDFTDDVGTLQEAILRQRAGGATALYDAIHFACSQRLMQPPLPTGDNLEVRRVLVLFSDGKDSMIYGKSLREALDACQRAEVAIYAISTSTDWMAFRGSDKDKPPEKYHFTEGDQVLAQLAEETGGRAFYPYRRDDLAQSFTDIGDELRSQYSLAYVPTNRIADGRFRTVQIKVRDKNLAVRARKGYYAPRPVQPRRIGTGGSSGS